MGLSRIQIYLNSKVYRLSKTIEQKKEVIGPKNPVETINLKENLERLTISLNSTSIKFDKLFLIYHKVFLADENIKI